MVIIVSYLGKKNALCRDHISIAILINLFAVFSTFIQVLFVHYGPYPYRWIALIFFIIPQLLHLSILIRSFIITYNDGRLTRFPWIPLAILSFPS